MGMMVSIQHAKTASGEDEREENRVVQMMHESSRKQRKSE
jgi:hypothetical protein